MLFRSSEIREIVLRSKKSKDSEEKIALSLMAIAMILYNDSDKIK